MNKLPRILYFAGIGCAIVAVIVAFASMETKASASHHMRPESAIALAIAGWVLLRASEQKPPQ